MTSNGAYSTVNTSESHKTGRGCILADILEVEVDQKYFLSKEQTERIIFKSNSSEQEKVTTETPRSSDGGGVTETVSTAQGGGREHHTIEVIGSARPKKDNFGEDRERVFDRGGIAPTLRSTDHKEPVRVGVSLSEIRTLPGKG